MNNIGNILQINLPNLKNIEVSKFTCNYEYNFYGGKRMMEHKGKNMIKCENCGNLACDKHIKSDKTLCINCTTEELDTYFVTMCASCGNINNNIIIHDIYVEFRLRKDVYICGKCQKK